MCLLILKPKGKTLPSDHIREAWKRNSHGGGYAWVTDEGIKIRRGFFNVDQFIKFVEQDTKDSTAIIHMRFATHGGKTKNNCHPHWAGGGWVCGHNGILELADTIEDESDTVAFIRDYVFPIMEKDPEQILNDQDWIDALEATTVGSKLVFLGPKGEYKIIHEEAGHWDHEVWYSNWMYLPFAERPKADEPVTQDKPTTGVQQSQPSTTSTPAVISKTPVIFRGHQDFVLDEKSGIWEKKNEVEVPLFTGGRFQHFHQISQCEMCQSRIRKDDGGFYDRIENSYLCRDCKDAVESAEGLMQQVDDRFNKKRKKVDA